MKIALPAIPKCPQPSSTPSGGLLDPRLNSAHYCLGHKTPTQCLSPTKIGSLRRGRGRLRRGIAAPHTLARRPSACPERQFAPTGEFRAPTGAPSAIAPGIGGCGDGTRGLRLVLLCSHRREQVFVLRVVHRIIS